MWLKFKMLSKICLLIFFYIFKFCKCKNENKKEFKITLNQLIPDLFMATTQSSSIKLYNLFDSNFIVNFIEKQKMNSIKLFNNSNLSKKFLIKTNQENEALKNNNTKLNSLIRIKLNKPFFQETARLFCKFF